MNPKQSVHDEFLVKYYIDKVLPLVCTDKDRRTIIQKSLEKFNNAKYDFKAETESTYEFYLNLDSLSRSLKFLGASEDRIGRLLSVLKKLQDLLFQLPNQRDHLPHQLRAYLLGSYMLHTEMDFFAEQIPSRYAKLIAAMLKKEDKEHSSAILQSLRRGLDCNPQIIYDIWSLAGLCHDVGYSVQGVSKIATDLCKIYGELIPELNMHMTQEISPDAVLRTQMESFENALRILYPGIGSELAKYVGILKELTDHGVWSCFFISSEDLADRINENIERLKLKISRLTLWDLVSDFDLASGERFASDLLPVLYAEALIAIALHNRPHLLYLSPLLMLLVMSDTLQEWNRVGNLNVRIDYQVRDVYLNMEGSRDSIIVESEIYAYDCIPIELYDKITADFLPSDIERSKIDLDSIRKEFIQGSKFVIRVGPSSDPYVFSI